MYFFLLFVVAAAVANPIVGGNLGLGNPCYAGHDGQVHCGLRLASPSTSSVAPAVTYIPSLQKAGAATLSKPYSRKSHSHQTHSHSHNPHSVPPAATSTSLSPTQQTTSKPVVSASPSSMGAGCCSSETPPSSPPLEPHEPHKPSSPVVLPPNNETFKADEGKKWTIKPLPGTNRKHAIGEGALFSSTINRLGWDKGRTSSIDGRVFWNFGDVLSVDGVVKGGSAGFSMGAAFYANQYNPLRVDMEGIENVTDWNFAKPWTGHPDPDPVPGPEWLGYGMDTSNTAQVAPGVGIAYGWEIFRNEIAQEDKGGAMLRVTLGEKAPIATRFGPLFTGPDAIAVGSMTIFNPNLLKTPHADGYLFMYTIGAGMWDGVIVGRVPVADAFDHNKYQFLKTNGQWDTPGVIPKRGDTSYGMGGKPISNSQGSIIWNDYLGKYQLFVGYMGHFAGFHTSDTPWGPWSPFLQILDSPGTLRYGVNVHPELCPNSTGKQVYVSWGTNVVITLYELTLDY